jgi:hypothetical protein
MFIEAYIEARSKPTSPSMFEDEGTSTATFTSKIERSCHERRSATWLVGVPFYGHLRGIPGSQGIHDQLLDTG